MSAQTGKASQRSASARSSGPAAGEEGGGGGGGSGGCEDAAPCLMGRLRSRVELAEGERLVLECNVSGSPRPAVNWYCDQKPLVVGKGVSISYVNTLCQLVISNVTAKMTGEYMCRASNPLGKVFDSCRVTVRPPGSSSSSNAVLKNEKSLNVSNGCSVTPVTSGMADAHLPTKSPADRADKSPAGGKVFGQHLLKKADSAGSDSHRLADAARHPGGTHSVKRPPVGAAAVAPAAAVLQDDGAGSAASSGTRNKITVPQDYGESRVHMADGGHAEGACASSDHVFQSSIQIKTTSRQASTDSFGSLNGAMVHVRPGEEIKFLVSTNAAAGSVSLVPAQLQKSVPSAAANLLLQSRAKAQSVEDLRRAFSGDGDGFSTPALRPPQHGKVAPVTGDGMYTAKLVASKDSSLQSLSTVEVSPPGAAKDQRVVSAVSAVSLPCPLESTAQPRSNALAATSTTATPSQNGAVPRATYVSGLPKDVAAACQPTLARQAWSAAASHVDPQQYPRQEHLPSSKSQTLPRGIGSILPTQQQLPTNVVVAEAKTHEAASRPSKERGAYEAMLTANGAPQRMVSTDSTSNSSSSSAGSSFSAVHSASDNRTEPGKSAAADRWNVEGASAAVTARRLLPTQRAVSAGDPPVSPKLGDTEWQKRVPSASDGRGATLSRSVSGDASPVIAKTGKAAEGVKSLLNRFSTDAIALASPAKESELRARQGGGAAAASASPANGEVLVKKVIITAACDHDTLLPAASALSRGSAAGAFGPASVQLSQRAGLADGAKVVSLGSQANSQAAGDKASLAVKGEISAADLARRRFASDSARQSVKSDAVLPESSGASAVAEASSNDPHPVQAKLTAGAVPSTFKSATTLSGRPSLGKEPSSTSMDKSVPAVTNPSAAIPTPIEELNALGSLQGPLLFGTLSGIEKSSAALNGGLPAPVFHSASSNIVKQDTATKAVSGSLPLQESGLQQHKILAAGGGQPHQGISIGDAAKPCGAATPAHSKLGKAARSHQAQPQPMNRRQVPVSAIATTTSSAGPVTITGLTAAAATASSTTTIYSSLEANAAQAAVVQGHLTRPAAESGRLGVTAELPLSLKSVSAARTEEVVDRPQDAGGSSDSANAHVSETIGNGSAQTCAVSCPLLVAPSYAGEALPKVDAGLAAPVMSETKRSSAVDRPLHCGEERKANLSTSERDAWWIKKKTGKAAESSPAGSSDHATPVAVRRQQSEAPPSRVHSSAMKTDLSFSFSTEAGMEAAKALVPNPEVTTVPAQRADTQGLLARHPELQAPTDRRLAARRARSVGEQSKGLGQAHCNVAAQRDVATGDSVDAVEECQEKPVKVEVTGGSPVSLGVNHRHQSMVRVAHDLEKSVETAKVTSGHDGTAAGQSPCQPATADNEVFGKGKSVVKSVAANELPPPAAIQKQLDLESKAAAGRTVKVKTASALPADATHPRFVIRPRTQYVKKGQTATLRCLPEGQPKPVVTWMKDGAALTSSPRYKMYVKNDFCCLDISSVDAADHGEYLCVITNTEGSVSATVELDVSGVPSSGSTASLAAGQVGSTSSAHAVEVASWGSTDDTSQQSPLCAHVRQSPHGTPSTNVSGSSSDFGIQQDRACFQESTVMQDPIAVSHVKQDVTAVTDNPSGSMDVPSVRQQIRVSLGSRLLRLSEHYSMDVMADDVTTSSSKSVLQRKTSSTSSEGKSSASSSSADKKLSPRQLALDRKLELLGADALALAVELDEMVGAGGHTAPSAARDHNTATDFGSRDAMPSETKRVLPEGCESKVFLRDAVIDETWDTNPAVGEVAAGGSATSGTLGHTTPFRAPRFTKPLQNQELIEGDSVTIECLKSPGSSVSTVTARQHSEVIHELDTELNSLEACADAATPDASSMPGFSSGAFDVPDAPPSFLRELSDCVVMEGQAVELLAEVSGAEPVDIVWVHNDEELSTDNPDYQLVREGSICRLLITDVFVEDAGTYICEAYNKFGDCDTACSLTVRAKGGAEPPSLICPLPATLGVCEGATVSLSCRISNVDPLDVTWNKNGRMARQGQRFKVSGENDTFTYEIQHVLTTDAGTYEVNAANDYGTVSCQCSVSVSSATPSEDTDVKELLRQKRMERAAFMSASRPKFLEILQDVEVTESKSLALLCRVDGSPAPDVQWYIDGREVKASQNVSLTFENKCAQLVVKEVVAAEHQGRYTCVATNKEGQEKTTGIVTVKRAKSSCTVPNPPVGKPFVTDVTSQGMTVAWYGPDFDGGSQVICYKVEMCKLSLLKISQDKFWKTLTDQCKHTSYRVTSLVADAEYVFRVRAINAMGEGPASDWSETAIATDRRLPSLSDSESQFETESTYSEYSEYSEYAESEYDYDLDEAFSDHVAEIHQNIQFDDRYEIKNLLGKGKFGAVYLCTEKCTGRDWAAKRIKCRPSQKSEVMNEIDIMNDLRHPKLVRLWEVFEGTKEMVLVTEYVSGGELFERIAGDDFDLTETDCVRFTKQICDGVQYMHEKSILHLDLKPENIICTKRDSNQIKLIDFGLARRFKNGEAMKVMFGTPEFVAPEVINFEPIDFTTDMWSVGVITYVLLSGLSPFCGDTDRETLTNVTKGHWEFDEDAFADISLCAKDFVSQLLVKRKECRMSAADCCRHLWLADSKLQRTRKLRKSKEKMKKFVARRKWQKTGMAIRALGRIRASLQSPSSHSPHAPSHDSACPPPAPAQPCVTRELIGSGSSQEKDATVAASKQSADCAGSAGDAALAKCSLGSNDKPRRATDSQPGSHGRHPRSDDSGYEGANLGCTPEASLPQAVAELDAVISHQGAEEDLVEPVFVKPLVDVSVVEGMTVRLVGEIKARPAPTVVWYKDGQPLPWAEGHYSYVSDGCKHSLVIDRVKVTDDAEYECRAFNEAGEASSFAELYVTTGVDAAS